MAAKSGAGSSVSSGAGFQARVGAYLLVTAVCDIASEIAIGCQIASLSFETTEAIDDINVTTIGKGQRYIQAKAAIDYSLAKNGELRSVFQQFERQHCAGSTVDDRYILATTRRASRKVINDLRAALDAFRSGDEKRFRQDQAKALVDIIDDLLVLLTELQGAAGRPVDVDIAKEILRRAHVVVLDLEPNDPIEQAILLVLQSEHFVAPAAAWGKLISDCVSHSKARHTVNLDQARSDYSRFRVAKEALPPREASDLVTVEFGDMDFPVGREVALCRTNTAFFGQAPGYAIFEFYRFDDDCAERMRFVDRKCIFGNGQEVELIRRAATYAGMTRLIDADLGLVGDEPLTFFPMNSEEDFEVGVCADAHRARLRVAALRNPRPLYCIHCGAPVSENMASMVETGGGTELLVGLSHQACLAPEDRVIGAIQSEFFEKHSALINFDPNAWFRASHGGQMAFAALSGIQGTSEPVLVWGGRKSRSKDGKSVVELTLENGSKEIATVRNGVHRFAKADAEGFADRLNVEIDRRSDMDPLCYSDQSKAFGPRSVLLPKFGGREKLVPVKSARAVLYDERAAARYARPGNWYAPLLYLRLPTTGRPIQIMGSAVLFTDPFALENYLENWKEAGLAIGTYETVSLLTDSEFDDFMSELDEQGLGAIVNPLLVSNTATKFVSGLPVQSLAAVRATEEILE